MLLYGGYGHLSGDSISRRGTAENGLDSQTLAIMYRRLGETGAAGESIWPKDFAREIAPPAYVLAAALDAVFDDSAKLFQDLSGNAAASVFAAVEGQDHGFLKSTGKDPVAMQELGKAAQWIVRLATPNPLS